MNTRATAQILGFPEPKISLVEAYLRGLPSAGTRQAYARVLRDFGVFLAGRDLLDSTRRDVEAYRARLETAGRAAATVARALSALTGFFGFASDEGAVIANPAARARRPKVSDTSPRRALSLPEIHALLAAPDTSTLIGLRDHTLLLVLATQGFRISEALGIKVEDLAEEAGHRVVTVRGKGAKVCRVALAAGTWAAISRFMSAAGITSGALFLAITKTGKAVPGKAASPQAIWKRLVKIAPKAGVTRKLHAHLFRHSCVTLALAANVPLAQVQDFARHSDPRTTRRYDSHRLSLANTTPHILSSLMIVQEKDE